MTDTVISNVGDGTSGAGILLTAKGSSVLATLQRVVLQANNIGMRATGVNGAAGGVTQVGVFDSLAIGNGFGGFQADTNGPAVLLDIQRSVSTLNGGGGIVASGSGAQALVGSTISTLNNIGFQQLSGGIIRSYGNNSADSNTSGNGTVTGPVLPQM